MGWVRVALAYEAAREIEEEQFHYHHVQGEPDHVNRHELDVLLVPLSRAKPPKCPQAVPRESVGYCDAERGYLRDDPMPADYESEDPGQANVDDHAGEAD